jgi:uncharacterized protein (DUF1015 family)
MIEIVPFKAFIYNQKKIASLDKVVAPAYDTVSPEEQQQLYNLSSYNIIRLSLGMDLPGDNQKNNKYTRAAAKFSEWLKEKILVPLSEPAIFPYQIKYQLNNREASLLGLVARFKLQPFSSGNVIPHERTFSAPKTDRLMLLEACQATFDQVYGVCLNAKSDLVKLLRESISYQPPLITTKDKQGSTHTIWAIHQPETISKIANCLSNEKIFIADGHHRYETAINYQRQKQAELKNIGGREPFNFISMFIVDANHQKVEILPTHRLIKNVTAKDKEDLLKKLLVYFKLTKIESLEKLTKLLSNQPTSSLGILIDDKILLANPENNKAIDKLFSDNHTPTWKSLSTSLSQAIIEREILGLENKAKNISYHKDWGSLVKNFKNRKNCIAILTQPVSLEQIQAIIESGETMPQKSTYFYPKPLTGMLINKLE